MIIMEKTVIMMTTIGLHKQETNLKEHKSIELLLIQIVSRQENCVTRYSNHFTLFLHFICSQIPKSKSSFLFFIQTSSCCPSRSEWRAPGEKGMSVTRRYRSKVKTACARFLYGTSVRRVHTPTNHIYTYTVHQQIFKKRSFNPFLV